MSDPAVEAVQRVKCAAWQFIDPPGAAVDVATRAAREALKPIREKIRELQADIPTDDPKFGEGVDYAIAESAPFIYSSEELER